MPPDGAMGLEHLGRLLDELEGQFEGVFRRYRIPAQDAEDLLQDSVTALIAKADIIETPAAWLMTTLRHRCADYWRHRRRWVFEELDRAFSTPPRAASRSPEAEAWRSDLHTALAKLPERCRLVLHQRYGLGCSALEIATRTGYSEPAVRQITHRCLSALMKQLRLAEVEVLEGDRP